MEAVAAYGEAWDEPDEAKRRELLERAWADEGTYLDSSGRADGREALVQHIGGFHQMFADHRIEMASGVDEHGGYLRWAWKMVGPDGADVMEGVDFAQVDEHGKLTSIVGFFGPWPEVS